jgi:ESS family glutamate:Na+ symporter
LHIVESGIRLDTFLTVTLGIVVLFIGKRLTDASGFLREYSIPEPVSGGLLVSVLLTGIFVATGFEVTFNLAARDVLLVYFFTTIGMNASFRELIAGGWPLILLLGVTIGYMILQNVVGISMAAVFDLPAAMGLLGGSVALIGGHGTAIAWSGRIAEEHGIANALEVGVACATFGLILASLMGGPIAKFLITRYDLRPAAGQTQVVGTLRDTVPKGFDYFAFLDAVLAIHVSAIIGIILNGVIADTGLQLPLFVTCLFAGILISNLIPDSFPRLSGRKWPSRTAPLAMIADISLGTFLAMSLMSMQLWTLVDLALPILGMLTVQFLVAVAVTLFVVFRVIGRNYDAAVVAAGFGGISLGSTPTAMANMSAVTKRYGPSQLAFIIVPLVCAFFIDLVNAIAIPTFLSLG